LCKTENNEYSNFKQVKRTSENISFPKSAGRVLMFRWYGTIEFVQENDTESTEVSVRPRRSALYASESCTRSSV